MAAAGSGAPGDGGWPPEIFEDGEDAKAESLELVCTICQLVMRDPTALRCTNDHALCRTCADRLARQAGQLRCPLDREVVSRERLGPAAYHARRVNEMKVHCSFKARGCTWTGELGSFSAHESKCTVGRRACSVCAAMVLIDDLHAHEDRCALVPRACPNAGLGCTVQVTEPTRAVHMERCLRDLVVRSNTENSELRSMLKRRAAELTSPRRRRRPLNVWVATDEDLQAHHGLDLINFDEVAPLYISGEATIADLRTEIAQQKLGGAPEHSFRLWTFVCRLNRTVRPNAPLQRSQDTMTLKSLLESMVLSGRGWTPELRLWVEPWRGPGLLPAQYPWMDAPTPEKLIFLKFFLPEQQRLEYAGFAMVQRESCVGDLGPVVRSLRRLPPATQLLFFEEVRQTMIDPLDPWKTLADSELDTGDVVICQINPPPAAAQEFYQLAPEFFQGVYGKGRSLSRVL